MTIATMVTTMAWGDWLQVWVPLIGLFTAAIVMQWYGKLPTVQSWSDFASILNSRGGNIMILSAGGFYFFRYSMSLFNSLLGMVRDKTISEDNAFALMAIQFVTTGAFGACFGALLKTMTGENSKARASDNGGGDDGKGKGTVTVTAPIASVSPIDIKTEPPIKVGDKGSSADRHEAPSLPTDSGGNVSPSPGDQP